MRLIEIPDDGIVRIPIVDGESKVGERCIDLSDYPTVQPEVRRGKWIDAPYTFFGAKRYECSNCYSDTFWNKRFITIKENFCPNCGADMREVDHD